MTPAERRQLEAAYDRFYTLYDEGKLRPAELDEMHRIYEQLGPTWEAEAAKASERRTPTIQAREPSVGEEVSDWLARNVYQPMGFSERSSYGEGRKLSGLLQLAPGPSAVMAGLQVPRDVRAGDYGMAALNAATVPLDLLGVGPVRRGVASLMRRRGGPEPLGSAAADAYMLGDRLVPASSYRTATPGRPSQVMLPSGERFDAKPINPIEQAALEYMQRRGMDTTPMGEYPQFSEQRARMIAAAYDQMLDDPGNPAVKRAYDAMVQETLDQYNALKNSGIEFKFLRKGMRDPYDESPALGYQDLVENGRLYVFPTDFGYGDKVGSAHFDPRKNPLLTRVGRIGDKDDAVANDAFRAVHDAYGHFGPGNPFFRHKGEERAFLEHSRMYSPEARAAMTSETRGQNSWLNFGPHGDANRVASVEDTIFADQKIGMMPSWTQDPYGMPPEDEIQSILEYIDRWSRKRQ